jgi:hypothetical protein
MSKRIISVVAALVAVLAAGRSALATIRSFEANLDGLQEVPPDASPAFGLADVTLNDATGAVSITTGTYQDLLGGSTAVTLNGFAAVGSNASVLITLTLDTPGAATGTFSGGGTLADQAAIDGMIAGNTYINIRSQVFPTGEIRGQVLLTPEPASVAIGTIFASAVVLSRHKKRANSIRH